MTEDNITTNVQLENGSPAFAKPVLCCRFFLYFLCGGCILFCLIISEL